MIKSLIILTLIALINIAPVEASICRNLNEHLICILTIKRSAKYHWEYRVSLSIDGVKTPVEIYNCRDQFKITKDQRIISFDEDHTGELICNLVD
jgi:hypothetical protein